MKIIGSLSVWDSASSQTRTTTKSGLFILHLLHAKQLSSDQLFPDTMVFTYAKRKYGSGFRQKSIPQWSGHRQVTKEEQSGNDPHRNAF